MIVYEDVDGTEFIDEFEKILPELTKSYVLPKNLS